MDQHRQRNRDLELGARLYLEGRPYASITFYAAYVRIGWRRAEAANLEAKEAIRARARASIQAEAVVDIRKLDALRRGAGNKTGTSGGKGR